MNDTANCETCGNMTSYEEFNACVVCGKITCPDCLRIGPPMEYGTGYCPACVPPIQN